MCTDPWVLSGLAAAVAAGCFWMLAVQESDLGYAYPFMALSFVLVPLGASVLFGEPLPLLQLSGLALIVTGVALSALAR
jgi:multidrug transporter EmrE-like cation transporter